MPKRIWKNRTEVQGVKKRQRDDLWQKRKDNKGRAFWTKVEWGKLLHTQEQETSDAENLRHQKRHSLPGLETIGRSRFHHFYELAGRNDENSVRRTRPRPGHAIELASKIYGQGNALTVRWVPSHREPQAVRWQTPSQRRRKGKNP